MSSLLVTLLFLAAKSSATSHWIVDGNIDYTPSGYNDITEPQCVNDTSNQGPISSYFGYDIAVGCCSVDGSTGIRPDCNAYPRTYGQAVQLCDDNGYRLCSKQELLQKIGSETGCSFDYAYLWSASECNTAAPTAAPSVDPTAVPSVDPTASPSVSPTSAPSMSPTSAPSAPPTLHPTPICPNLKVDIIGTPDGVQKRNFEGLYLFVSSQTINSRPLFENPQNRIDRHIQYNGIPPNGFWVIEGTGKGTLSYGPTAAYYPPYDEVSYGWTHNNDSVETADVLIACIETVAPTNAPTFAPTAYPAFLPTNLTSNGPTTESTESSDGSDSAGLDHSDHTLSAWTSNDNLWLWVYINCGGVVFLFVVVMSICVYVRKRNVVQTPALSEMASVSVTGHVTAQSAEASGAFTVPTQFVESPDRE